jgi:hypothetical protein
MLTLIGLPGKGVKVLERHRAGAALLLPVNRGRSGRAAGSVVPIEFFERYETREVRNSGKS